MQQRDGRILAVILGVAGTYWLAAAAPPLPGEQGFPQPKKSAPAAPKGTPAAAAKKAEAPADSAAAAAYYLDGMLRALGGAERVNAIRSMRLEWMASYELAEQSERPEGPFLQRWMQGTEDRDVKKDRFRIALQSRSFLEPRWNEAVVIGNANAMAAISGEQQVPTPAHFWQDFHEPMLFSPERLATTAREGKGLAAGETVNYQGTPHVTLTFTTASGLPARILLSKDNLLPSTVEWTSTRSTDPNWNLFGDVRTRIRFSVFQQDPGGIRFPRVWDVERNGKPFSSFTITSLAFNPVLDEAQLNINGTVERVFQTASGLTLDTLDLGIPNSPAMPVDPRVLFIPGRMGVTLVRQDDGVLIIDAPLSNGYSKKVIDEAAWRHKGLPVKGAVMTTDSWITNGGLREYVAASVPLYVLDLNRSLVETVIASPHTLRPDSLAARPKPGLLTVVSQRTTVGTGPGRLELIPMKTSAGERSMMVYFPESKVLYASTMVMQMPDRSFVMPAYLGEVISVVQREKLEVAAVYSSMLRPIPYQEMVQFYNRIAASPLPEGK